MISLIVAHDTQKVIGKNNDLPWHLPEDLAYFKKMTMGKAMVMGRKTYESIGRPLPGRLSIVITRNPNYKAEGVVVVNNIEAAIEKAKEYAPEVMVIGGAEIFKMVMDVADRLYITLIQEEFAGDTFFPEYEEEWTLTSTSEEIISKNGTSFIYQVYDKK